MVDSSTQAFGKKHHKKHHKAKKAVPAIADKSEDQTSVAAPVAIVAVPAPVVAAVVADPAPTPSAKAVETSVDA